MISEESWSAIQAIVEARKARGEGMDRVVRAMSVIAAVGEWNCKPSDEACAKIAMRVMAMAVEQGVDLDAAIAEVSRKFGKPLPDGGSRLDRRKPKEEASS